MISLKKTLFLALFCCFTSLVNAQIKVYDKTATDLVTILTGSSSCVTIIGTPIVKGDDNNTSGLKSYGSFDQNGSSFPQFPITSGIVLSTWSAKNSEGPFVRNIGGGTSGWGGDLDLKSALNSYYPNNIPINATSLEFDIKAITNLISFDYIFASNEYEDNYACRFSDGFAFLIKDITSGSTAPYTNIAVIPGTTLPVSVFTVHKEIVFTDTSNTSDGCPQQNQAFFGQSNISTGITSPINYAGQTIKMTAQAAVIPNNTYHIKLVIADDKEIIYDSAVFLEAGSFSSKINISASKSNPVCFGESLVLDATLAGATYKWFKVGTGSITPLGTNPTFTVSDAGTYKVEVNIGGCPATGEIKVEFAPEIKINTITPLSKCDDHGDGTATFDLNDAKTDLLNGNPSTTTIEYFETKTPSGLSDIILDPSSFKKTSLTDQTVYAKLSSVYGCEAVAEITLKTNPSFQNPSIITPKPLIHEFSGNGNSVTLVPPTTSGTFEYSLDGSNYQASPLFTNLTAGSYTGYIRDSSTCEYSANPFIILDYPRFFTPNEDTFNDEWEIKNLGVSYPNASISIFDRYGKLLKQITAGGGGWRGTFYGLNLPADDYWFIIDLKNGEITKGHFSLKR